MSFSSDILTWTHGNLETAKRWSMLRKHKKRSITWRSAEPAEYEWFKTQPNIEALGDFLYVAPDEDDLWLLIERTWHGWPDPPRFACLAFDVSGKLIVGGDFEVVPATWTLPE